MAAPDIGTCLSAGIDGFKKDPITHIVTSLLVGIVGGVTGGVLTGPMMVGYMRMIKRQDEGQKVEIADVFKGFDDVVPALLAVLLSTIIVAIGFMLCVIPGLLIMALVPTSAYLVAVGEKDGINAIRRAFEAVKDNLVSAFLCALVLGIVGGIGSILCGIGVIFTFPIGFIGSYHMAKQLTNGGGPAPAIVLG
ncbi:MAG: hypothetical protein ABIZ09_13185 [Rhodoferax sp.]